MALIAQQLPSGCDGFRVESERGLVGWVEETWLGLDSEPAAFALRCIDGRRALLSANDVEAVVDEEELLTVPGARLLELEAPRLDGSEALPARLLEHDGRQDRSARAAGAAARGVARPPPLAVE